MPYDSVLCVFEHLWVPDDPFVQPVFNANDHRTALHEDHFNCYFNYSILDQP